jgi:hypothetical protein
MGIMAHVNSNLQSGQRYKNFSFSLGYSFAVAVRPPSILDASRFSPRHGVHIPLSFPQTAGWVLNFVAGLLTRADGHNLVYLNAATATRKGGPGMV